VVLVPWLAAVDRARSFGGALAAGLLLAVGFALVVFPWFATAIAAYTGVPRAAALLVLVLLAPVLEPQLVGTPLVRHALRRAGAARWQVGAASACAYVGIEWAVPKLFGDTLGQGLYASRLLRQGADLAGTAGLTLVLLAGNELVLAATRARPRRALAPLGGLLALVLALAAYGGWRCRQLAAAARGGAPVTVGVVQADISQYDRLKAEVGTFEAVRRILDAHFALSAEVLGRGGVDLLVWPETVYPTTFGAPKSAEGAIFDRDIAGFVTAAGVPLVFGAYDVDGDAEFNAAVFLEPGVDGRATFATYRKARLFPLTERVPALLGSAAVRRALPWLGSWQPGPGRDVIPVALPGGRRLRVAPLICYDAVDADLVRAAVRRGADALVTLSNDSWFAAGMGPRLHLVVSAFRSVETRRPQVRATNTGISAVISPAGDLLAAAGVDERTTLVARVVPAGDTSTPWLAAGDWLGPAALAGAMIALLARRRPAV